MNEDLKERTLPFSGQRRLDLINYYKAQCNGRNCIERNSTPPEEVLYVHDLALKTSGDICEIGVFHYFSSIGILMALETNKTSRLWSIDPWHRNHNVIPTEPFNHKTPEINARWIRVIGSSQDVLPVLENKFSLIFMDGLHRFGGPTADFKNSMARLRPGGIIAVHDTNSFRLRAELHAIRPKEEFEYVSAQPDRHSYGLGIWRSPW